MGTNMRSGITLDDAELAALVGECRTATLATIGAGGLPHLSALWFAVENDRPVLITKARSQKAVNLRHDPRLSVLLEAGRGYGELRGAVIEGTARLDDAPSRLREVVLGIRARYPEADAGGDVESAIRKRVAIELDVTRVRSWDHRKLAGAGAAR